jgi:hypothetical protein
VSQVPQKSHNEHRQLYRHSIFPILAFLFPLTIASAGDMNFTQIKSDPHRNKVGFFDIHVCNWPDRPLFFMALFSTEQFDEVESVKVLSPNNEQIGSLDMSKFRLIRDKKKPEKHVFIKQFDIPDQAPNGWYRAEITLRDGTQYDARDYVIISSMQHISGVDPADESENMEIPRVLKWDPIPGAKYYQVFIRDEWSAESLYQSKLLTEPKLVLSDGLLKRGGYYSWQIHARDVNENILLGDFNHGSLSKWSTFSIADSYQSAHKH